MTKECPSCAMVIEKQSGCCPVCQYEFPQKTQIKGYIIAILLVVIFLLTLLF